VEWADVQTFFGTLRDLIGDAQQSEQDLLDRFTKPAVLILSDLAPPAGDATDFQRNAIFRLIDRRYRDLRPTWVSLNVSGGAEAENRVGAQVIDRLRDAALILPCNWPSFRRPQS
jgi:DNA replication protein DnaC